MLANKILRLSLLLVFSHLRAGQADSEIEEEMSAEESNDSIVVENSPQYGLPTTPWLPFYFFSPMMPPQYSTGNITLIS